MQGSQEAPLVSSESLFVYGSLKRGLENHTQLASAVFIGEATTAPGFALFRVGGYPALVRAKRGCVHGELYSVRRSSWSRLDDFEGCPWLYVRELIELSDGRCVYAYLMPEERVRGAPPILFDSWPSP
jgi:gamma-glutamylaminecyclotransferase